jgi:hypothetical protein
MRANGTSSFDLLDGVPAGELAKPTAFENLFLIPSMPELAGAAVELSHREGPRASSPTRSPTPRASTSCCSTARPRSAR